MQIGSVRGRTLDYVAIALLSVLTLPLARPLPAQCQLTWQPGIPATGIAGIGYTISRLPSGDVVVAGRFATANGIIANNVARYDGTDFHALGSGVDGDVVDSVVLPNGDLVVAGNFLQAGGVAASHIARWDGSSWLSLGSGVNARVLSLATLPNGDLIAAGQFAFAGGVPCNGIARWDGASWSAFGGGPALLSVDTVEVTASGDLYAGGSPAAGFTVQRWNGSSWSNLPGVAAGEMATPVDLQFLPNGDLVVAENAASNRIQLWDGTQVIDLQPPLAGATGLSLAPNGDLLAHRFTGLVASPPIQRFDGTNWTSIGSMVGRINDVAIDGAGNLLAAGNTIGIDQRALFQITGSTIASEPIAPPVGTIQHTAALPNGDVVVAGSFSNIDGVPANNVAIWDGATFRALGQGVNGEVTAVAVHPSGDLLVAGSFTTAGVAPALRIARWDGTSWSQFANGLDGVARHLAANRSGEVLAVLSNSNTNALRWFDGQSWIPQTLPGGTIEDLVALPSGDFVLGGLFTNWTAQTPVIGGLVFSAGSLQELPDSALSRISAMTVDPEGVLVVAQRLSTSSISRVLPSGRQLVWSSTTNRLPSALQYLPNGDLVAALPDLGIARRTGFQWTAIDGGVLAAGISGLAYSNRGELIAIGSFDTSGSHAARQFARARTNCPAAATPVGSGCAGSVGPVDLITSDLPWLGSSFETTATGMTTTSLAVQVIGTVPITVALPFGAVGCSLLVEPVTLDLLIPEAGAAQAAFGVPNDTALLGQDLLSQVIGLELGASLALQQTTASNALQLTLGAF